jgi:hypothetical protein
MKVNIEIDMTPEEARKVMGLPDLSKMQEKVVAELQKRITASLDLNDPQAMLKAWMPLGGLEQFQQFLWDSAKHAVAKKDAPKSAR